MNGASELAVAPAKSGRFPGPLQVIETATEFAGPEPHELFALTVTFPALVPIFTLMAVLPCPFFIDVPGGTVHVYEVAPAIDAME